MIALNRYQWQWKIELEREKRRCFSISGETNYKGRGIFLAAPALKGFMIILLQTAFFRNPERMHRVQALTRLTSPDLPSMHRIF
jgi:hypothetical protein